jgi:pimeloyl-ACP methyl ester carboxylesterase
MPRGASPPPAGGLRPARGCAVSGVPRGVRAAWLLVVLAVLAGCAPATAISAPEPGAPPEERLRWGPCLPFARTDADRSAFDSTGFDCAHLEVPLDHDDPDGEKIRIGVLRRAASDPAARVGALVVNPGGPGASGMSLAAGLARRLAVDELTRHFDLVGFDPRGVGASEPPVVCRTTPERDADRADTDEGGSDPAAVRAAEAEEQRFADGCAERSGPQLLARLGSRDVARDMDLLREALGEEQLTYLGYSYGTRIGTAYAALFPDRVRAMVLDGAVDPDRSPAEAQVAQAQGFQRAFDAVAAWCAGPECPLRPGSADADLQALLAPLEAAPVPAGGGRELGRGDATVAVLQALYSNDLWPPLRRGLAELAGGSGSTLLQLADLYHDRQRDGSYSNAADVLTAVRCVDEPRITDPAQVAEIDAAVRAAAPFLDDGSGASPARGACAFWPVPPDAPPVVDPAGLPPVVVVSTTGDPATPYEAGVELARVLGGRLVTAEGNRHTAYLAGTPCLDGPVTAYLIRPERLPAADLSCVLGG